MSYQLPAWSPVSLGVLAAGVMPSRDAESRLERRIALEYGARRVTLTAGGTDALAISLLAAAPEGRRPRVALPAWACYDLMTAADLADAEVLLYDLVPETLSPDLDSLSTALAREPHAVVVAHWFGLPVDLGALEPMAQAFGAVLVDDAAQGVGASMRGRPVGGGGAYGVLSFGRGKGRTGGAGGAVMAFTDAAAESLSRAETRLRSPGSGLGSLLSLGAQWALGRPSLYGIPVHLPGLGLGETVYHRGGEPSRIARRNAAVVDAVWEASSRETDIRRANAMRWQSRLAGAVDLHSYTTEVHGIGGWLRYPVLTTPRLQTIFRQGEARRHGVMPGYPGLLADLPVPSGRLLDSRAEAPGARRCAEYLFTLPTHHWLRDSDLERIGRWAGTGG